MWSLIRNNLLCHSKLKFKNLRLTRWIRLLGLEVCRNHLWQGRVKPWPLLMMIVWRLQRWHKSSFCWWRTMALRRLKLKYQGKSRIYPLWLKLHKEVKSNRLYLISTCHLITHSISSEIKIRSLKIQVKILKNACRQGCNRMLRIRAGAMQLSLKPSMKSYWETKISQHFCKKSRMHTVITLKLYKARA